MIKLITLLLLAFLLFFTPYGSAQTSPDAAKLPEVDLALRRLQGEIARAAESAGGIVGMSAVHLESGRKVGFRSGERFPMASAYKIPIAVQLLCRVDRGEITLAQMVELQPRDLRPGSGMIAGLLKAPGVALSVRNLLELMLLISDNTATDLLLRMAGGPDAVTARVRSLGIGDLDVNRPTVNLIAEQSGYLLPPEAEWNPELFQKLDESVTEESRKTAGRKFAVDTRDTSTPEAMSALLEQVYRGDVLMKESKALLQDIMERCQTGKSRLKGILPPGSVVAHKTGTLSGIANDAGVMTLPDGAGRVAIAVFIKSSEKNPAERDRAIAQIGRAVYDYFLFQPPPAEESK